MLKNSLKRHQSYEPAAPADRRGAVLVEFAIVLPLLLMLVFGIIELGRAVMVQNLLVTGAREGARAASLVGETDSQVQGVIDTFMANTGITGFSRTITPSATTAVEGTAITVTVSVPYVNVSWLPAGTLRWMNGRVMHASVTMRREQ